MADILQLSKEEQLRLVNELIESSSEVEDDSEELDEVVSLISSRFIELEDYVDSKVEELSAIAKVPGPAGKDGRPGADGRDGQSIIGPKGEDGKAGQDGADGQDGKSIVDVYWAADGSLVCVLSDGTEIDAGVPLGGNSKGGDLNATINQWAGYSTEELKQTFIAHTFETVNKNLAASSGVLAYNANGDLITITYDNGILKTLAYDSNDDLASVTLSGATPEGIMLVKTFAYDSAGDLISFTYS